MVNGLIILLYDNECIFKNMSFIHYPITVELSNRISLKIKHILLISQKLNFIPYII